jgi:hypothetical protein
MRYTSTYDQPTQKKETKMKTEQIPAAYRTRVIQAHALKLFALTTDVLQHIDPLNTDDTAAHERRARSSMAAMSGWLSDMSSEQVERMLSGDVLSVPDLMHAFDMPENDDEKSKIALYDGDALCLAAQAYFRDTLSAHADDLQTAVVTIHAVGKYLSDVDTDDHKMGWMAGKVAEMLMIDAVRV